MLPHPPQHAREKPHGIGMIRQDSERALRAVHRVVEPPLSHVLMPEKTDGWSKLCVDLEKAFELGSRFCGSAQGMKFHRNVQPADERSRIITKRQSKFCQRFDAPPQRGEIPTRIVEAGQPARARVPSENVSASHQAKS